MKLAVEDMIEIEVAEDIEVVVDIEVVADSVRIAEDCMDSFHIEEFEEVSEHIVEVAVFVHMDSEHIEECLLA